jgi:hypothetical protein
MIAHASNSQGSSATQLQHVAKSSSSTAEQRPNSNSAHNDHLITTSGPDAMAVQGQEAAVECRWRLEPSGMASLRFLCQETDVRRYFRIVHQLHMFAITRLRNLRDFQGSDLRMLRSQAIAVWESDVFWSELTCRNCNGISAKCQLGVEQQAGSSCGRDIPVKRILKD